MGGSRKKSVVKNQSKKRNINSYGYDVSNFGVLDMSVLEDSKTNRLTSVKNITGSRSSKKVSRRTNI